LSPLPLFWQYWIWTQGFELAKQALYHLSHISSPFGFGYFGDRLSLFCPCCLGLWSSYVKFPTIAGMTGSGHHAQLFSIEMWSCKQLFDCFGLGWPFTVILPFSASCRPGTTGTQYHTQLLVEMRVSLTFCLRCGFQSPSSRSQLPKLLELQAWVISSPLFILYYKQHVVHLPKMKRVSAKESMVAPVSTNSPSLFILYSPRKTQCITRCFDKSLLENASYTEHIWRQLAVPLTKGGVVRKSDSFQLKSILCY
jgi:hypothetical protein